MKNKFTNFFYWKIFAIYSKYSEIRLYSTINNIKNIIKDYTQKTESTGTKFSTLYRAIKIIKKNKPKFILESGTGTSTIVLAETLIELMKRDPSYHPKLISMESIPKWYELAKNLLPEKYNKIVEIILGEREKFEYAMFRGYVHSNIPKHNYDFIFIDGPRYDDQYGTSCCLDALKIRLISNAKTIVGIVDTRVSSVFAMQNIFGIKSIKYFHWKRFSVFRLNPVAQKPYISSESFDYDLLGLVKLKSNAMI